MLLLSPSQSCESQSTDVLRLVQLDDQYGSPSFDDISAFHSMLVPRLASEIGQDLVDQIELEISSPVQPCPHPVAPLRSALECSPEVACQHAYGSPEVSISHGDVQQPCKLQGAERAVKVPEELERFKHLPMLAQWNTPSADPTSPARHQPPQVVCLVSFDPQTQFSTWKLANVKANRGKTGRLTKKQQQQLFEVAMKDLTKVHLYIEV